MDLKTALGKMEQLLALMDQYFAKSESFGREGWDRVAGLYGEIYRRT